MKKPFPHLLLLAAGVLFFTGCHNKYYNEELPGFPQFSISEEAVDFGRLAVNEELIYRLRMWNVGPPETKLYAFCYIEGDPAFRLIDPREEVTVIPDSGTVFITLAFAPAGAGEKTADLVIYHSDRPLKYDENVTTQRVRLIGYAATSCDFPGLNPVVFEVERRELER